MSDKPVTILCLAGYEKGGDFLCEAKQQGARVLLITVERLRDAAWPKESIDEVFYMPDLYNRQDVIHGVSYLARGERIDRIVSLDEFDLEMAAILREHLRLPGMGESVARHFRDKLAMRKRAQEAGILVPDFAPVFNYDGLRDYMARVPPPWVLKPRTEASALGIKKIDDGERLWRTLDELGDKQSFYVLERYVSGDVFHLDALIFDDEPVFAEAHRYVSPPFNVMHGGGVSGSRTLKRDGEDVREMRAITGELVRALGMQRGVVHTEFIKGQDGRFYFLEIAARVGGANIADMVEAATGVNLWREWAKIEIADARGEDYRVPEHRQDYAGVLVCLAKQEWPDLSAYTEPEIVWRMKKHHHAGLIVASSKPERVQELQESYMKRFYEDFLTSMPAPDKPPL
jgi:carbamoylphosphate synthase large subunit